MLPLPQGPPLEHLFSWCFVSGFRHICSSFSVLFWVNRKVQLAGVADCFDFCAICYLHLNLQIFCGQTNWTARGVRSPEDLHFVLGAFILGSVCLTQMRVRGTEAESSDKCTNLVLRAWPSCQYLHNVRLSFIFFYFFTVAPLTSPPGRRTMFFQTLWRLPEFDCLPLFAWNKMLWLMAWLHQRHLPYCSVWLSVFFFWVKCHAVQVQLVLYALLTSFAELL